MIKALTSFAAIDALFFCSSSDVFYKWNIILVRRLKMELGLDFFPQEGKPLVYPEFKFEHPRIDPILIPQDGRIGCGGLLWKAVCSRIPDSSLLFE